MVSNIVISRMHVGAFEHLLPLLPYIYHWKPFTVFPKKYKKVDFQRSCIL